MSCPLRTAAERAGCYVIAGPRDDDDGTLYWSNTDGWGWAADATVFTAAERETLRLPIGDDARWVDADACESPTAEQEARR